MWIGKDITNITRVEAKTQSQKAKTKNDTATSKEANEQQQIDNNSSDNSLVNNNENNNVIEITVTVIKSAIIIVHCS